MSKFISKESILNFYKTLEFTNFDNLSFERKEMLDEIISKNSAFFKNKTEGPLSLRTLIAERLTTSYKNYGLVNGDEKAYFFIKIVDPTLQHLEILECANTSQELKEYCLKNFNIYDKYLIFLEKKYNEKFQEYEIDYLWNRDSIKR